MSDASHLPSNPRSGLRRAAVAYLVVEGLGVLAWWAWLLGWPAAREAFRATDSADATLLAFVAADGLLVLFGAFVAAYGLARSTRWAFAALCVHGGAVVYAALYGVMLWVLDARMFLGALLMTPPLLVLPILVWRLRPRGPSPC